VSKVIPASETDSQSAIEQIIASIQAIINCICTIRPGQKVTDDGVIREMVFDSLDMCDFLNELDARFDANFTDTPDKEINELTVRELAKLIYKKRDH